MQKEILTIEEACQLLQISKKSLYKLAKEQKIPSKKILNKWRFDKEALKAWVGGRNTDKQLFNQLLEAEFGYSHRSEFS